MTAFYNEIDPKAASWLRELIRQGHIADGIVDERSIEDITPDELSGFTQCHFFAGIGVWSHALRQAGWPDDRPVWTGSCPCQAFSAAGKGAGFADERHLWPAWFHLIEQCRPPVIFGEQVEAAVRHGWLDLVQDDLEGSGYACGAVAFPAAGVGAPHIRQRLYFVADSNGEQRDEGLQPLSGGPSERIGRNSVIDGMGHTDDPRSQEHRKLRELHLREQDRTNPGGPHIDTGVAGGLANPLYAERRAQHVCGEDGHHREDGRRSQAHSESGTCGEVCRPSPTNGFWGAADWLHCTDGKWRPVEPGTFPLAHGSPARVGRLRGYGNAIVAPAAQAFIAAYLS